MKQKIILIIGRFQPFHGGHLHLIKRAIEQENTSVLHHGSTATLQHHNIPASQQINKVVIGIGSANILNDDNPFSFEERKARIEESLKKNGLYGYIVKIVPLLDYESDEEWLSKTLKTVGKFDVAFGNNEWTNGILEKAGYVVVRTPLHKRELYEGKKIRAELKGSIKPEEVLQKHLP